MSTRRENLARAAGFFNGEGCTRVQLCRGYPNLDVSVTQVDRRELDQFHSAVDGLGTIDGPYAHKGGRPQHKFRARKFEHAQAVIAMLWPWLSEAKREQAKKALSEAAQALRVARRPGRPPRLGVPVISTRVREMGDQAGTVG